MYFPDVNLYVYALRGEMPHHDAAHKWLEAALRGGERVAVFEPVLVSALRIVTNRRIFKTPTPMPTALQFLNAVRQAPAACNVESSSICWDHFLNICMDERFSADDVQDAYLASVAIGSDAVLVSSDKGFQRFSGLKWLQPF